MMRSVKRVYVYTVVQKFRLVILCCILDVVAFTMQIISFSLEIRVIWADSYERISTFRITIEISITFYAVCSSKFEKRSFESHSFEMSNVTYTDMVNLCDFRISIARK